ncbi:CAP domain-containing protein [Jannaschia rubra]|uniref:Cysteine-rich secretory protein family protein n=1 Tax=Jannaschia rubra TaxID=282197 RepID=A0A0M6XXM0_9RHOB|nr:CAP domain-containing protein [Jannaschia rubra]CTQ34654.1 Cysteine-rich secretory protein family protein [Jannaschia rubra]SFG65211.1 Uncharacterized conserved protein YkwD, contains CAP (CSP/antigen 5/PR1) domain [Jannaschia rubra]
MTGRAVTRGAVLAASLAIVLPTAAQEAVDPEPLRQRTLDLVNAARIERGVAALAPGPALDEAAQDHAEDMLEQDYYAHVAPDGETPADRFRAAGGSRWALSGENIARCTGCAPPPDTSRVEAFQEGWMQSPGHRENILDPGFDRFGFGIAGGVDRTYAVQTFAGPGEADDGPRLDAAGARAAALEEVNRRRQDEDLAPLDASEALDAVAERVLDARLSEQEMPEGLFDLLPEGASGWTSLTVRSASRGGSGAELSQGDVVTFVEKLASGGARASHLGFAAAARDDGRNVAVAVFGGRD